MSVTSAGPNPPPLPSDSADASDAPLPSGSAVAPGAPVAPGAAGAAGAPGTTTIAPPPAKRTTRPSFWPAIVVMIAATGGLLGVGWRVIRRNTMQSNEPRPLATADAFADGLIRGDGPARDGSGAESTGLRAAYDLLSSAAQARVSFDEFYEEWTRRGSEAGFFERSEWAGRGFRGADNDTRQVFTLSSAGHGGGVGRSYRLRVTLVQENDRWRVAAYDCEPAAGSK